MYNSRYCGIRRKQGIRDGKEGREKRKEIKNGNKTFVNKERKMLCREERIGK